MRNTMKFFVFVAFIFAALTASAQTNPIKLGHLDTDKLLSIMPEFKDVQTKIQQKFEAARKESEDMRAEFAKKYQEYQQNAKRWTDIIRETKEQELQQMNQRIQDFDTNAGERLDRERNELMAPLLEKIKKAITEVGKENGYTYIFAAGALLFAADNSDDVLPLIKKKLGIL